MQIAGEGVARPEGFSDEKIVSEHSSEWLAKWHDPVTHQDTHCRGISGEKDKFDFARLVKASYHTQRTQISMLPVTGHSAFYVWRRPSCLRYGVGLRS